MSRIALSTSVLCLIALSACSAQQGTPDTGGAATPAAGAATPASTSSPSQPGVSQLGASVKYPDGLVVSTSKPTRFTPSDTSAGYVKSQAALKVVLTVTNGTKKPIEGAVIGMSMSAGEAGEEAEAIFDSAQDIGCTISKKILPGDKATAVCAFSVPKASTKKLQAEVRTDFDHDKAIFTGSLGA